MKPRTAWLTFGLLSAWSGISHADVTRVHPAIGESDGAYGRFSGDTAWSVGAGPEFTADATHLGLRLEAHYFYSAGIYLRWSHALTGSGDSNILGAGISLRPAFLPRFGLDLEQGPAYLDLFLDSISLALGAFASEPDHGLKRRGFELSLGAAIPFQPTAEGVWLELRGGTRWPDASELSHYFTAEALICYRSLWASPALR